MSTTNNISNFDDEDLKNLSPRLSKLSGKSPFKADDHYFDAFSSKLKNRISDFEEIKTEAPVLSNITKYNAFEVPKTYFDEFPTRIQEAVTYKTSTTSFLEWLILLIKPSFAIPVLATLCIAFAGINYMEKHGERTITTKEYGLSDEEQLYMIDESTIIEAILSNTSKESEITTEQTIGIENYLIDNNIDETNLNTEL